MALQGVLRALQAQNSGLAEGDAAAASAALTRLLAERQAGVQVKANGEIAFAFAVAGPLEHLLGLALAAIQTGDWPRFKVCRDPDCRASFFDATRNGSKTWCAVATCASRNKMRRARRRKAQA